MVNQENKKENFNKEVCVEVSVPKRLFKAKRMDNGEWVIGNLIYSEDAEEGWEAIIIPTFNSNMFTKNGEKGNLGFENWYRVDKGTICQYTGKDDLKERRIYNNDILKDSHGYLYKVYWSENHFAYSCVCVKSDNSFFLDASWDLWSLANITNLEVVGNIFDNPEVLGV